MTKDVTIKIKVKPFTVPNFVVREVVARPRQDGIKFDDSGIPLSDLDAYTLEEMCEEFTNAVFAKAGKQRPPQSR